MVKEVISSKDNTRIKNYRKLHTAKGRKKTNQFLIEGVHLVEEAVNYKQPVDTIIIEDGFNHDLNLDKFKTLYVSGDVMKSLSTLDTPPGIAAVVDQQKQGKVDFKRVLLLEDIQDPGNLGTLIRTADAFGFKTVLITPKSADPYNPKVLRSAQGSHFHLDILQRAAAEAVESFKGIKIGTSLNDAVYIDDFNKPEGDIMLVLGNEGQGLTEETLQLMDINAKINMPGSSESLNVAIAGAIMMHHFKS